MPGRSPSIEIINSDLPPVEAFRRLSTHKGCFFLDSALRNPDFGRYSFLGALPLLTITSDGGETTITRDGRSETIKSDPFEELRGIINKYRGFFEIDEKAQSTIPFTGGLVGYLGYDLKNHIERLPARARRDQRFPDMSFGLYDCVLCHDHLEKKWRIISRPIKGGGEARPLLRNILATETREYPRDNRAEKQSPEIKSNFTHERYLDTIRRTQEYIAAGDIFQANISQRFECRLDQSAAALYEKIRATNPAPFCAFIRLDEDRYVLSSSPERFLKITGRDVQTRPIKGTSPRRADSEEDAEMKRQLLASGKDAAELAMIVDLERNDLGRVCEIGSIKVAEARAIETYATVHHTVATVTGILREDRDIVGLLKAAFPGGSITGAPKIRAMEIIDELEPTARSVYTGAIGYIGFGGRADLNIAIRTLLYDKGRITFQVGGGIVADSDPELEFEETLHKAEGIIRALK